MNKSHYDYALLASWLEASGLTHEGMAALCGVKRLTITRVVNGRNASWDTIALIVEKLNENRKRGVPVRDARSLLYTRLQKTEKALAESVP